MAKGAVKGQINTQIDGDVRAALDAYIADFNETAEHKANIRSTTEAAFRMFLKEKGFWPLPNRLKPAKKAAG